MVAGVVWFSTKNWMSRRVNGVEMVSVPPAQYSPGQMSKKNTIQVMSSIAWSLGELPWATESMQWIMETGRGRTFLVGGVFLRVGHKLLSQTKVDGAHVVESCIWSPHGGKYMSHGAGVLLHTSFVDRLVVGCKGACADLVIKYL